MMATASKTATGETLVSLRERKKLATRHELRRVALRLIADRGFSNVTVEEISEAANVSPRTFFNYFSSKEAVLLGADPEREAATRDAIVHSSPGEPAMTVLRTIMASQARVVAAELTELGGDPVDWLGRVRAARTDPQLRAAHAAQMAAVERTIAEAIAQRLGTDLDLDPYPGLLAATATGVFRSSMTFWAATGGTVPLDHLVDLAFRALGDGLPERCDLRRVLESVTANVTGIVADRKDIL
jgi:AcrR family transcriptional regulator